MALSTSQMEMVLDLENHLRSSDAAPTNTPVVNNDFETKEQQEKVEYPDLNDPHDRSPLKINLPSLSSDKRQYRLLRLEKNGIKILLIHHPIKVTSEVLLRVAAGSYDEPNEFPGLAHFLEHMLFMGSTKYPDEDDYHRYIETHSGEYNAHTNDENTDFSFTVENEHLEPMLDRLAQFFISPLLKADCAEREIQAVEQEFEGVKEADMLRFTFVGKRLVNPKHPESRFDFGNRETLQNIEQVLPALHQFYDEYYKANNMTLILESKYSLDEQEILAEKYFLSIPASKTVIKKRPEVLSYLPDALQMKYTIESIQHYNFFGMNFVSSLQRTLENEAALHYIESLLSHTSAGGLFDYLKSRDLVTNISGDISFSVSYEINDDAEQNLEIMMIFPLTKTGLHRTDEIVKSALDYIAFLLQKGVEQKFFKELQDVSELQLRFKSPDLMSHSDFMDNLKDYPLEKFFLGSRITQVTPFPEQTIKAILASFSPQILQQYLVQDETIVDSCEIEPYTGAKFKRQRASAVIENWHEPEDVSALPFSLPCLSPYIPQDFSIKPLLSQLKMPTLIHDEDRLRVWLSHDHDFKRPNVQTDCYLISQHSINTPSATVCLNILFLMFSMELHRKLSRDFSFADTSGVFFSAPKGAQLRLVGYSDKHDQIIIKIFDLLKDFEFIEPHFVREKKTYRDALLQSDTAHGYQQALSRLPTLFNSVSYMTDEFLKALDNLDIKTLDEYRRNLLSSVKVELVCHGNMTPHELIDLGKKIVQKLNLQGPFVAHPERKIIKMAEGSHLHYSFKSKVSGNALLLFLQAEDYSVKTKYLCMLLSNILKPKYFDRLRTQEQLAYIIDCDATDANGGGLVFVIESSEYYADYLLEKTEECLEQMRHELESVSEDDFEANKMALNNTLAQINYLTSPTEFRSVFLPRFQSHQYQFNRIFEILKVSPEVTLKDLQKLYANMTHRHTCRQVVVKSQDEAWDAADLMELIAQNWENRGEVQDAIAKITPIIFSYAESIHKPYRIIEDISTFKKEGTCFPDYMVEGEQYIQSLLEFNSDISKENFANGEIVDEERIKDALAITPITTCSSAVDTVLTYCFRHYKMRESTKFNTPLTSDAQRTVTFHLA